MLISAHGLLGSFSARVCHSTCFPSPPPNTNSRSSAPPFPPHPAPRPLAASRAGLSLPQAQVLGELFGGRAALLDPPRPVSIRELVAFQAHFDRLPALYAALLGVWEEAYRVVARGQRDAGDFSFRAFMEGPVAKARAKPARARSASQRSFLAGGGNACVRVCSWWPVSGLLFPPGQPSACLEAHRAAV